LISPLKRFELRYFAKNLRLHARAAKSAGRTHRAPRRRLRFGDRDRISPLGTKKALIPAPARVSPAAATEQKYNEKNDQYGFHVYLTLQRKLVDPLCFLHSQHHKRDEDGYLFESRHIRIFMDFCVAR
jgi:hypothetical protein